MADSEFEKFKKRFSKDGKDPTMADMPILANPPPMPGPGGLGRAAAGAVIKAVRGKIGATKDAKPPRASGPKSRKSGEKKPGKKTEPRDSGTFTSSRRIDDVKKSRGPYGTLATQGTRAVRKFEAPPSSAANVRGPQLPAVQGSRSVTTGGGQGGGGGAAPRLSATAVAAAASKGGSLPKDADKPSKAPEKRQAAGTYTKPYDKAEDAKSDLKKAAPPKPKAKPTEVKRDAMKAKRQGLNKGAKKFDSKNSAGAKGSRAAAKPRFKANWKNAAPTPMQARGGAKIDRGGGIIGAIKKARAKKSYF